MNHSQGSLQWGKQVSAQRFDSPFLATDCQLQRSAERSFRPTIIQTLSNDYPKVIQRLSNGPLHAHCGLRVHIKGLNAFDRKVIQGDLGRGATPHKNRIWLVHGPRSRVTGSCMASPWPTPPSRIHTDTGGVVIISRAVAPVRTRHAAPLAGSPGPCRMCTGNTEN